jgi:hypothetical protein
MELKLTHKVIDGLAVIRPSRDDVQNLAVGDCIPDCFGRMARVVRIYAQRDDVSGKAFVCFYTDFGSGSSMSGSMKEGEIYMTLAVTSQFHRTEAAQRAYEMA